MGADLFTRAEPAPPSPAFAKALKPLPPLVVDGHLVFRCAVCTGPASFGFGVAIRAEKLGTWFCAAHKAFGA